MLEDVEKSETLTPRRWKWQLVQPLWKTALKMAADLSPSPEIPLVSICKKSEAGVH